jgi:exopolyphosphatase/pppGpp-phosphohydrolase
MKHNYYKNYFNIFLLFGIIIFFQNSFSNTLYGGIEIGSKGIKVTVLDIENAKKNLFTLKEFWTDNVGIAKGISVDGNLAMEDILMACKIVKEDYQKLLEIHKILPENIYIVASSGVGMAKNTEDLVNEVLKTTKKQLDVITSRLEGKLLFRGTIAQKRFEDSMILDIGGGNTKGGYVENFNGETNVFFPLNMNLGTITLTEKINKKVKKQDDVAEFSDRLFEYNTQLEAEVNKMYDERLESKSKKNIYISGGAVWAFYSLMNDLAINDNFARFTFEDVKYYDAVLKNNFSRFVDFGSKDAEAAKVLKTYSQKYLIAANAILIASLENLGGIENKKLYFVKQGQIAWLLSYVAETAKGAKAIY